MTGTGFRASALGSLTANSALAVQWIDTALDVGKYVGAGGALLGILYRFYREFFIDRRP